MKEVSCKALAIFFKDMEKNNLPVELLCEGLPYDLTYLRNKNENIEWDVFCSLLLNTRKIWNDDDYIRLGCELVEWRVYPILSTLVGFFLTVKEIYFLTSDDKRSVGKQYFRCVSSSVREIDKRQLEIKLELPPGYKYSKEFFLISKGFFKAEPMLVNLKHSKVLMRETELGASYNIFYPKGHTIFSWSKNIFSALLFKRAAIDELNQSYELLYERYYQLEESRSKIQNQAKQLETANSIGQLISSDLDLDRTINSAAEFLIRDAGFTAVEVTVDSTINNEKVKSFISLGEKPEGISPIKRSLEAHGHQIGEILLWSKPDANLNEVNQLLDLIIPTISIDTLNAISFKYVNDYRDMLELRVAERTVQLNDANQELASAIEKLKDLQIARDRFFASISHEFRTPLTLILGPSEKILSEAQDDEFKKQAALIKQNADRMLELIKQLLELSRLETTSVPIKARKENISTIIRGLVLSFYSYAKENNIILSLNSEAESIIAWVDKDKLATIINNLLSNAFKFTNNGGSVTVNISHINIEQKKYAEIILSDTGIGIPASELEKIFHRFYQVDESVQRAYGSSGIGLALVRELVELHRWNIFVSSTPGKGTQFHLRIPLWEDYLDENQKDESVHDDVSVTNDVLTLEQKDSPVDEKYEETKEVTEKKLPVQDLPSILIVEDSVEVRNYVYDLLKTDYLLYQASNGSEGLGIAQEKMPDLILSDVMMPEMNGMEFCHRIKTEFLTCHIPVILLTAKASMESKIEGLETGADSYLVKPFNAKELLVRIKNLLDQRKLLKEKFSKEINPQPDKITTNKLDDEFLQNVFASVEKHLGDEKFDSDLLAKDLFMSRMKLHRKLQAVTGEGPGEFIRSYKLKRAAQMLLEKKLSVTQIAYEVGYNSPSHFSKAFIKHFNCNPSDYTK